MGNQVVQASKEQEKPKASIINDAIKAYLKEVLSSKFTFSD
jgi:predicted DNA-binding protein